MSASGQTLLKRVPEVTVRFGAQSPEADSPLYSQLRTLRSPQYNVQDGS